MENFESNEIMNLSHFEEMTMGDKDLQVEILGLFKQQGEMWQKLLSVDSIASDFMVGAHTIKGSARSIGAFKLANICGLAEEAAKSPQLSRDEKYIWREQILSAMDEVLSEIANIEYKINIASLKN